MATFNPTQIDLFDMVAVDGTVKCVLIVEFAEDVILTGVPDWTLGDGLGNNHRAQSAAPHVHNPPNYVDFVHAHFVSVPAFGPYDLTIGASDPAVTNVGGDFVTAGTYTVTNHR